MHGFDDAPAKVPDDPNDNRPWYKLLNNYHWFVLVVSALGWLFDCLDQQLFILARPAAMKDLVTEVVVDKKIDPSGLSKDPKFVAPARRLWGDISTSIFIAGWATGGLIFGMLGDRIGRAKTMMITILLYSACTGLSAMSTTVYDFAFYRFLTGLGVGGEFAVGVALVAEVMPFRARPFALALLQALSAVGNISAALINLGLSVSEESGLPTSPWRIMFLIGALPALLALLIRGRLKEPEQWTALKDTKKDVPKNSYSELFADPLWRKHALLGLVLACSGVIGLWAVGFFAPDLTKYVLRKQVALDAYAAAINSTTDGTLKSQLQELRDLEEKATYKGISPNESLKAAREPVDKIIEKQLTQYQSYTSITLNVGAFLGMFGFGVLSQRIGRRPTFALALIAAFTSTVCVFWFLTEFWQIFVMVPIMGFCQLSLFSGYAIYFPELFPTRLRSTGTSFCYNVGRFFAALGPLVKAWLEHQFQDTSEPLRYAGVTMCSVFLIGLFVLPFLPETRGKPLPE
jgi:MFS family permease